MYMLRFAWHLGVIAASHCFVAFFVSVTLWLIFFNIEGTKYTKIVT